MIYVSFFLFALTLVPLAAIYHYESDPKSSLEDDLPFIVAMSLISFVGFLMLLVNFQKYLFKSFPLVEKGKRITIPSARVDAYPRPSPSASRSGGGWNGRDYNLRIVWTDPLTQKEFNFSDLTRYDPRDFLTKRQEIDVIVKPDKYTTHFIDTRLLRFGTYENERRKKKIFDLKWDCAFYPWTDILVSTPTNDGPEMLLNGRLEFWRKTQDVSWELNTVIRVAVVDPSKKDSVDDRSSTSWKTTQAHLPSGKFVMVVEIEESLMPDLRNKLLGSYAPPNHGTFLDDLSEHDPDKVNEHRLSLTLRNLFSLVWMEDNKIEVEIKNSQRFPFKHRNRNYFVATNDLPMANLLLSSGLPAALEGLEKICDGGIGVLMTDSELVLGVNEGWVEPEQLERLVNLGIFTATADLVKK